MLVNGFSDVMSKVNLATNGNFSINQRGLFAVYTPVKQNDMVADCWQCASCSIEYAEVQNETNDGRIKCKGYGKKGQSIWFANNDLSPLYSMGIHGSDQIDLTASVSIYPYGKVPFTLEVSPMYSSSGPSVTYRKAPITKKDMYATAILAYKTYTHLFNSRGYVVVTLMADGEFQFYLQNYQILCGAYRNPPYYAPVHYAENLARCERYYQTGNAQQGYIPMWSDGTNLHTTRNVIFRTKMAGTPTMSGSINWNSLHQLASAGNGSTPGDEANWSLSFATISNQGADANLLRSGSVANRDSYYGGIAWTAVV